MEHDHIWIELIGYPKSNFRTCLICDEPGWVV